MPDHPQKQAISICETVTDPSGDQVGFAFEYDDGSRAGVQCAAVRLPDIVNSLIDLGATAARQRALAGGSGGAIHVIPRQAVSVGASQGFGHSTVVFSATTAEGPPIHLALTPDLVQAAIQALEKALSEPPPSAASVMN
ncbi:hypothetical protein [Methylobacterium sp.]|jgi:hypothetical protein|uniref:hypothetical protein n=1 Tax=Methylobacterium sp. TaxID=409 RepID=UPI000C38775D|nr:hypothetical protein [Methylobacterium sp.]MBP28098.1 hypothetical protein [Methylobacterium sp.]